MASDPRERTQILDERDQDGAPTRVEGAPRPDPARRGMVQWPPRAVVAPPAPSAARRVAAAIAPLARRAASAIGQRLRAREQRPRYKKPPLRRRVRRWAWRAVTTLSVLLGLAFFAFAGLIWHYGRDLPETSELADYQPPQVTRILARDGTPIAELFTERRTLVPIAEVPDVMKRAVLAAEDARFYQHEGLNYWGILRAMIVNLRSGRARQGGSTITQQVIKNVLLTRERTFARKTRELILARKIEQELEKDQILELYLNHIYFGHGRYGVEEAARYYFGKSVRAVTLAEAALLAGLAKGPSLYSPRVDAAKALDRRSYVLEQMAEKRLWDKAEVAAAKREPIALAPLPEEPEQIAPEIVGQVEKALAALGVSDPRGGYTVTTTLDPALQAIARTSVRENIDAYMARHRQPATRPESALVALDVQTGEVLAVVGGYRAVRGGFDRSRQARRQPGSAFKPIVYGYGIHTRAFTAASILETHPAALGGDYRPSNYDESDGQAPRRLRDALAKSVNVAAVWTLKRLGPDKVAAWAQSLGIESKLGSDLSLALGAYEVTPFEMAAAYNAFAAGGLYREPVLIRSIVGPDGETLPLETPAPRRVMDEASAYVVTSLLRSVVETGTAKRARALRPPVAGKTGTSNEAKDAWFVGYSAHIACAVWTGYDDATPLGTGETGGATSLPAFIAFMRRAHDGRPERELAVQPAGIARVRIDPSSGRLAAPGSSSIEEIFVAGTEPTEVAPSLPELRLPF